MWGVLGMLILSTPACSSEETSPVPTGCAPEDRVGGACAGLPAGLLCDADVCTSGVECTTTIEVSDSAGLGSALAGASAGTCIALHPGAYGAVTVPAGVKLLGKSANAVTVAGVVLAAGTGTVLRGIGVGQGGVKLDGAAGARLESVRISGSTGVGLDVGGGKVDVVTSTIASSGTYGVLGTDGAEITVDGSVVAGGEGPGIWVACDGGCGCASQPMLSVSGSVVRDNRIAGINVVGAAASLVGTDVKATKPGPNNWHYGEFGGGVSASECSNLVAAGVGVTKNASFGVLVDGSSANLGGPDTSQAITISDNLTGLWVQNVAKDTPQTFTLDHGVLDGNQGVGVGVGGETVGIIIICKTAVTGTKKILLPVYENDMDLGNVKEVGDGLNWLGGAELHIDGLSLSGNERASILIDGPAKGSLTNVTLSGGDEAMDKGVVQQDYTSGDQPTVGSGAPPLKTSATELFSVPKAPVFAGKL